MKIRSAVLGLTAVAAITTAAYAAVTFDEETGQGFVGKGDVQLALGLNNKGLNDNAVTIEFQYVGTTVQITEKDWTCTRTSPTEQINERERTITTTNSVAGLVEHLERDNKKQITGFRLTGYDGDPSITSGVSNDGPPEGSCPTGWAASAVITTVNPAETTGGGLQVRGAGQDWTSLQ